MTQPEWKSISGSVLKSKIPTTFHPLKPLSISVGMKSPGDKEKEPHPMEKKAFESLKTFSEHSFVRKRICSIATYTALSQDSRIACTAIRSLMKSCFVWRVKGLLSLAQSNSPSKLERPC